MGITTFDALDSRNFKTISGNAIDPKSYVLASTSSKIRTFLYEIAEGTTNYRSLHSLTQQVEHQYYGRFLVELIQNAHDALSSSPGLQAGRVEIAFATDEGEHGTLYVANDGAAFSRSNFDSLSQLGQSDKDPQKSIGNKGIGFRSVLEVSEAPEVFSQGQHGIALFDGFCFRFSPQVLIELMPAVLQLAQNGLVPASPFGGGPLVDWERNLLEKFHRSVTRRTEGWLASEIMYLSPYLLPVPVARENAPPKLKDLEERGFVSVIRLPIKSDSARAQAISATRSLLSDTVLFLDRLSELTIDIPGTHKQITRSAKSEQGEAFTKSIIQISTNGEQPASEQYWTWERTRKTHEMSSALRESLADLPGKWPSLEEAGISIAVLKGEALTKGRFSIFLPTLVETGSAAHINAPFFGDMSRTSIDFDHQAYNYELLREVWRLAIDVVDLDLAGKDQDAARAIVDLLAPISNSDGRERWKSGIFAEIKSLGIDLAETQWFLAQDGWSRLSSASSLPELPSPLVFTEEVLREFATFPIFDASLDSRKSQLKTLADMSGYDVLPSLRSVADTCEAVAFASHSRGNANWNAYWNEVAQLVGGSAEELRGRRVLLGIDGQLHAAGEDCAVFFTPRRGIGEDDDVLNDAAITDIPARLQSSVAFLSPAITLSDPQNLRQQTPTRRFLDRTLVSRFRVQDIFSEVLFRRTPKLPVKLTGPDSELCADILQWGLTLLSNLAGRGKGDLTLRMLKDLALPCRGGWFKASDTSFGPGWPESKLGRELLNYYKGAGTADCRNAAKRLLLPPSNALWRGLGTSSLELLESAGVSTGIALRPVSEGWKNVSVCAGGPIAPPLQSPSFFLTRVWSDYRQWAQAHLRSIYNGQYVYAMQRVLGIDGLDAFDQFNEETKLALQDLLFRSIPSWPKGWDKSEFKKADGVVYICPAESPLSYTLKSLKWLPFEKDGLRTWHAPSEHWYVPAKVMHTREWQFEHLHPLPISVAIVLDRSSELVSGLVQLGMPCYDPETDTADTRLLEALADAAESDEVRDPNVFLGQVRAAWRAFKPNSNGPFPSRILVMHAGRKVAAVTPTREKPVYLPDSNRSSLSALDRFDLPVMAIDSTIADKLTSVLIPAFNGSIVQTSALRTVPLVHGAEWTPRDLIEFRISELGWIAPVALTLAAYAGSMSRGTASIRFTEQLQSLRETRIEWCDSLSLALYSGSDQLAAPEVASIWLGSSKILLAERRCIEDPRLVAESVASIIERDDIEVALKFALNRLRVGSNRDEIITVLEELRISRAQFSEVSDHWAGSLQFVVELLSPLLSLFGLGQLAEEILHVQTEDDLIDALQSRADVIPDPLSLIALARENANPYEFGLQCFERFGGTISLEKWRKAWIDFGGKDLRNREASSQFEFQSLQAKPFLRTLLRHAFRGSQPSTSFRYSLSELDQIKCPPDYAETLWEVRFQDAMRVYALFFQQYDSFVPKAKLLEKSVGLTELKQSFIDEIGEEADPIRVALDNRERLRESIVIMEEIGIAWAVLNKPDVASNWEINPDILLGSLDGALATDAYLRTWTDRDLISLLSSLPHPESVQPFWDRLIEALDLTDLRAKLGISEEEVANAAQQLIEIRQAAKRKARQIDVCGAKFDANDDNLADLWSHIRNEIMDEALSGLPVLDLSHYLDLGQIPSGRKPSHRPGHSGGPPSPPPWTSRAVEAVIGMAGEIHAFRLLQTQYGNEVVSPSSWISSNGALVFPENATVADDGAGCDFRFVTQSQTFFVEVKASLGADEVFALGSSEIRLAIELARATRRRKRERFVILRVLNALSQHPAFQILPNPYDERYRDYFSIMEAGTRIRYHAQ